MKCRLEVKVVPGSSRTEVSGWIGQSLKIKVTAAAEKGKANKAVIKVISEILKLNKSDISIVSGATSQRKIIEINGYDRQALENILPSKSG